MLDRIIHYSVRGRLLVVLAFLGVLGLGTYAYRQMPVDDFPDISPIMVPIFAEAHGMAPEEIERLVAYPIEASMNGLPDITQIKSTSAFGMAVVYVYFRDDVDIYFARQLVAERLAAAMNDLPEMHDPPTLGPISTGLGQVFLYYLTLDPGADTQGKPPDAYLREVNDCASTSCVQYAENPETIQFFNNGLAEMWVYLVVSEATGNFVMDLALTFTAT